MKWWKIDLHECWITSVWGARRFLLFRLLVHFPDLPAASMHISIPITFWSIREAFFCNSWRAANVEPCRVAYYQLHFYSWGFNVIHAQMGDDHQLWTVQTQQIEVYSWICSVVDSGLSDYRYINFLYNTFSICTLSLWWRKKSISAFVGKIASLHIYHVWRHSLTTCWQLVESQRISTSFTDLTNLWPLVPNIFVIISVNLSWRQFRRSLLSINRCCKSLLLTCLFPNVMVQKKIL